MISKFCKVRELYYMLHPDARKPHGVKKMKNLDHVFTGWASNRPDIQHCTWCGRKRAKETGRMFSSCLPDGTTELLGS